MEVMELKKDISRQISDSAFFEEIPKEVPEILKTGLQASCISMFFVKPDKVIFKRVDLEESEMIQFADNVEADMLEQKSKQEAMQAQLMEVIQGQKSLSVRQAAMAIEQEKLNKLSIKMRWQENKNNFRSSRLHLLHQAEMSKTKEEKTKKQYDMNSSIQALLAMMQQKHNP